MDYQQMNLFKGQESDRENSHAFQGASHASLIRLQDCVRRLVMNVIYGRNTGASLAKLSPNGLWLKMYGDSLQANLDGSFEEYSGILPTWGMMQGGVVIGLPTSEQFMPESGLRLLPTPTANLEKGYSPGSAKRKMEGIKFRDSGAQIGSGLNNEMELLQYYRWEGQNLLNPLFLEAMMGFPEQWTAISASETQ